MGKTSRRLKLGAVSKECSRTQRERENGKREIYLRRVKGCAGHDSRQPRVEQPIACRVADRAEAELDSRRVGLLSLRMIGLFLLLVLLVHVKRVVRDVVQQQGWLVRVLQQQVLAGR